MLTYFSFLWIFYYKELLMKYLSPMVVITILALITPITFANQPTTTEPVVQQAAQSIDINHAGIEELSSLKGIGSKKAQAIIEYREIYGNFTSVDALLNVKGIGDKVLSDNLIRLKI